MSRLCIPERGSAGFPREHSSARRRLNCCATTLLSFLVIAIESTPCSAQEPTCKLTLRAVDPFGQEVRGLRVESFVRYMSEAADVSARFKNGFAVVPHGRYNGVFRIDGRHDLYKESNIRVHQARDVHYVIIGRPERVLRPAKPWYGRVHPVPPGRRAWVKFVGVYLKGAVSVEADELGHFAVSFEREGLYSAVVVWDYQVQYTRTVTVDRERKFLDIDAGREAAESSVAPDSR